MDTVSAFEADIGLQPGFLESFEPRPVLSEYLQERSVFCGSGDSLSAAMLAESFSGLRARGADPLDITRNREAYSDKHLYVISISGNTASNIRAASVSHSTAITAAAQSRLARACAKTVLLDFPSSGVFTAGSIGFLASALACISMVSEVDVRDVRRIFEAARRDASRICLAGHTFVLGDHLTYPVAMYCAAKLHEVVGYRCQYERTEQFSHAGMFSARPGDTVLIFGEDDAHARRLCANLEGLGIGAVRAGISGAKIQQVLYLVFFSQFLALGEARSKNLVDCYFVTTSKTRDASSDMIY